MTLHIIVDGYNLIRASRPLSALERLDLQAGREGLIARLAAYKKIKRHKITVVFDGSGPAGLFPRRERLQGIAVRYSHGGETADAVIKRMAAREREKAVVVSSDREIVDHAAGRGAATLSAAEFEEKLEMAALVALEGPEAEGPVDGWRPTTRKKGPSRRLPKRARRDRDRKRKL